MNLPDRSASLERVTRETRIRVALRLDCSEPSSIDTGIGFLDHMLATLAKHGRFALEWNPRRRKTFR